MAKAANEIVLNELAVKIAIKLIKPHEGCILRAYPDPASALYKALSTNGVLHKYMNGDYALPDNFAVLSGNPWTIGYGNTEGVKAGDVWPLERAESDLVDKVMGRMLSALKACPKLSKEAPERMAAITSLVYNIGINAFAESTACRRIMEGNHEGAAEAITWFNKARGEVMPGLVTRRKAEKDMYLSVRGN